MVRWESSDLQEKDSAGVTDDSNGDFSSGLQQGYELGSLTDGLVAYFPFNGGVEDKALSHSVTDNTSAGFVEGKIGEAKDFDGSDDYVDIPSKVIDAAPPVTFSFWFNLDSELNGEWETFLSNYDGSSGIICGDDDNEGKFRFWVDGTEIFGPTVETNKWFHYVGQILEDGTIRLYFDGKLEDKGSTGTSINTGEDLRLGMRPNEEFPTSVKIDDLRIYDRALSRPEIQALYQRTSTQKITDQDRLMSGLVGHWPLNEDDAGKAYDLSGNNYDSTSVSGTSTAVGIGGTKARSFDSANSEEVHLDTSSVSLSTYSVSFWANTENISADGTNGDYLFDSPNNTDRVYIYDSSQDVLNSAWGNGLMPLSDWQNNSWNLVTLVNHSDGGDVDFYYNGVKQKTLNGSGLTLTPEFISLGGYNYEHLDGKIADFRIYNRPLTKSEIEAMARNGGLDV